MKDNFIGYRILGWWLFLLSVLQIFCFTLFLLAWFQRDVWCNSYPRTCIHRVFTFGFFQEFLFVFDFLQFEYDMPCYTSFGINPVCCSLSFLHLLGLVSIINFRKISVIIAYCFKYLFCSFLSFFSFLYSHDTYYTFYSSSSWIFFSFFILFCLCISLLQVSIDSSSSSLIPSLAVSSYLMSPSMVFFISVTMFFISGISFLILS